MSASSRIGIGLWTMQSTAGWPANFSRAYEGFSASATLIERYGFDSIWSAEHRFWYDGWCPAPLHAAAFAAAHTSRIRFGTAMLLLPQHDASAVVRNAVTLDRLTGGRVELGFGLGYRDEEFAAVGVPRKRRGRLMDEKLGVVEGSWPARVWLGGMAPAALARAARRGHGLLLPQTLAPERLRAVAARHREAAPGAEIGILRDVHVVGDRRDAGRFRERVLTHYREEILSWWSGGLERQLEFVDRAALIGGPDAVAEGLQELCEAGASYLVIRLNFDFLEQAALQEQVARLAEEVVPRLDDR